RFKADIAADLNAHVCARDIIETHPVQAANLHVLDRLGLDGKIGCLRPSYRNEPRCRAKEKTFPHLHLEPPKSFFREGSVSAQCDSTRWNFPLLRAGPRNLSHHLVQAAARTAQQGDAPLRRCCHISGRSPLSNEEAPFPQALLALFGRVLRKKHAVVNGLKRPLCLSQSRTNTYLFSVH